MIPSPLLKLLTDSPLVLLFLVVGLGFLFGSLSLGGASLGVAGVLFAGIAIGALAPGLSLPPFVYEVGLVLFVYCVGLQSGPGFVAAFRRHGLRNNAVATGLVGLGALLTLLFTALARLDGPAAVGVFCGSLTTTPGLAAAVDLLRSLSHGLAPEARAALLGKPVVTYGLSYPYGVLGVLLAYVVFNRIFRIDFKAEEQRRLAHIGASEIHTGTFRLTNPDAIGRTVLHLLEAQTEPSYVPSRVRRGETVQVVTTDLVLAAEDLILCVGTTNALAAAQRQLGPAVPGELDWMSREVMHRRILVSNHTLIGRRLDEIGLEKLFPAIITRLRRGDVDFVPRPDTILEPGDRIRVVAPRAEMPAVSTFFGDSLRDVSEADFLAVSLGLLAGLLLGLIPVQLPSGLTFRLGFAGGPLIMGMLLGWRHRSGPLVWSLPYTVNLALRQFGLVLFLAVIGLTAGHGFARTFAEGGWGVIAAGMGVTTLVASAGILICYRVLKMPMPVVMGMVAGVATQPACLAFAQRQADSEAPLEGYSAVYPAVMIAKIIVAQLLVTFLTRI